MSSKFCVNEQKIDVKKESNNICTESIANMKET